MRRLENHRTSSETVSDLINSKRIKHEKIGTWDYYEKVTSRPWYVPGRGLLEQLDTLRHNLPYAWIMLKDIGSIQNMWIILSTYVGIRLLLSFYMQAAFGTPGSY